LGSSIGWIEKDVVKCGEPEYSSGEHGEAAKSVDGEHGHAGVDAAGIQGWANEVAAGRGFNEDDFAGAAAGLRCDAPVPAKRSTNRETGIWGQHVKVSRAGVAGGTQGEALRLFRMRLL